MTTNAPTTGISAADGRSRLRPSWTAQFQYNRQVLPQIPPRNVNWSGQGYWVHMAKVGFEKYFLRKVRNGSSEPGYERFLLKTIGVERLKRSA